MLKIITAIASIAPMTALMLFRCAPEPATTAEPVPEAQERAEAKPGQEYTLAQFESLETGMTLGEVEELLGAEGELLSTIAIDGMLEHSSRMWQNPGGSNMVLNFEGDRLTGKTQFGLR